MRFALIGAAGYISPRHLQAIKAVGGEIVAVCDPSDSVGILDKYGYDIGYFSEFERFDRHLDKLRREGKGVDYVSICSPNYLHDAHIRCALRNRAHAICEKPLVINPWNLDAMSVLEEETGKKVYTVLQLRYHPEIMRLKAHDWQHKAKVTLTYNTPRGAWYKYSWKSDMEKSGGILTNIGIHLFDMLLWVFGPAASCKIFCQERDIAMGQIATDKADVKWLLSLLPKRPPSRSMTIDDVPVNFSGGFADLHTEVYKDILAGRGYGIEDARPSIELAARLRNDT